MSKLYKWKKINYKTFLPKHAPVVVYIVAKANMYDRHGIAVPIAGRSRQGNHIGGVNHSGMGFSSSARQNEHGGTQRHFMMHAAAHAREFDRRYTQSDVSRQLRNQGTRLMTEDR